MDEAAINAIVESVVRSRFDGAAIETISVEHDVDFDGDPVLRITVVFDPAKGPLDLHKVTGITRHVRHGLAAKHVNEFPIFRFMSASDAADLASAAA